MSRTTRIADAVVRTLGEGSFSQELVAVRAYRPAADLAALERLHATVVPRSEERRPLSRGSREQEVTIDIGLQRKVDPENLAEQDELDALAEEVADYLEGRHLPEATFVSISRDPVLSPEHLDQHRVFTTVISVTYRITH